VKRALAASDVSAVVCTLNSGSSIRACLTSLGESGVGQIVVVDASSVDGTKEIAHELSDLVVTDPGSGLGHARNIGIARTTGKLILNMGSDNVMPRNQLQLMIEDYVSSGVQGVSAQTFIEGNDFVSRGLNAWRSGRFKPGVASVIGTPTLFDGELLRENPYDSTRRFSDDSELCERWASMFGATFLISRARVQEIGKASWDEVLVRCRMYGISDDEVFRHGSDEGWSFSRRLSSIAHPARADFIGPLSGLPTTEAIANAPFLATFAALRYAFWAQTAVKKASL
jgi:glycosyltransferase involved in cell wall biosynthesis